MAEVQLEPVVVAVGASAGGVEALSAMAAGLPRDLRCSIVVALHMATDAPSGLDHILDRNGPLTAKRAVDGAALEPGMITVAVPNRHLTVRGHRVALTDEPPEHGHRPAIDTLFASVAADSGPRSIGVLLSGVLDDGVTGLAAIRSHGGTTIVQRPTDARFPAMPTSAITAGVVDHQSTAYGVGALLAALTAPELPQLQAHHG